MPFSISWLATPAGPHVLQVIAYRADGTQGAPAVVNVVVGLGGSGLGGGGCGYAFGCASCEQAAFLWQCG